MADERTVDYGETAYNAYVERESCIHVQPYRPMWSDLEPEARSAWGAAAVAVIRRCREGIAKEIAEIL